MVSMITVRESITGRYKIEAENNEFRFYKCGVQVGVAPISELGEEMLIEGKVCSNLEYCERVLLLRLCEGIRINKGLGVKEMVGDNRHWLA